MAKLLITATYGYDNANRAAMPFYAAKGAKAGLRWTSYSDSRSITASRTSNALGASRRSM